jgi:predicted transcriptional regulator of viral defense system
VNVRGIPDHFLSRGRYSATTQEISALVGVDPAHLASGMARLRRQRQVFSPARGLYCFVPPEYRSWGVLPGEWFIDDMMRHLGRDYYVALLSAAAIHGAAHHAPQVFQVITAGRVADRDIHRVRLRFITDRGLSEAATEERAVPSGRIRLATREQTALDLVTHPHDSGGWDNVATVLAELDQLDGAQLARLAKHRPIAVARRLGWLVDRFADQVDSDPLAILARRPSAPPTLLEPSAERHGPLDDRWALVINKPVEAEA